MMKLRMLLIPALLASCTAKTPAHYGPCPSEEQMEWQKMETNMFVHFGPNTFSGKEWGDGTEAEDMFSPSALDCGQWAETAKAAGFKGIVITAKHHDGFCLWPTSTSSHSVAASRWREGKGDVLRELSEACHLYGLKFGVYLSPWDRNHPAYGYPEYNSLYAKALEEVHTGYGEVFEQWFDGACKPGPNGRKQTYDWPLFHETVRRLSPRAVMFSDVGPGCRWMGNERGEAGTTNWSRLDIEGFEPGAGAPPLDTLKTGNIHGSSWIPAETDVSIRPGWFWKESENDRVKSPEELLEIYYKSVGRNSLLLLNIPPDDRGRIFEADSLALLAWRGMLDSIFSENLAEGANAKASSTRGRAFRAENILDGNYDSYWAAPDGTKEAEITFSLPEERRFNRILLQEYIPLGQRICSFEVEASINGRWKKIAEGSTVGYKRILLTDDTITKAVRLRITGALACPLLNNFALYYDSFLQKDSE